MTTIPYYMGIPDVTTASKFQGVSAHALIGYRSLIYPHLDFYPVPGSHRCYCVMKSIESVVTSFHYFVAKYVH